AYIGKVVGLGLPAKPAFLDFDEISHVRLVAHLGAGPQAGIGTDARLFADAGLMHVAECLDHRAFADFSLADDAMRPDADAVRQRDLALEHAAYVDEDVAAAAQAAAQVEARGVGQGNALLEQATRLLALPDALELGL